MYNYILGEDGPPEWMGFAMIKADGEGLADELTHPDPSWWPPSLLSEPQGYQDSKGRRWCLLSTAYENSCWGGLVELHGGSSLAIKRQTKQVTFDSIEGEADMKVSLDSSFADQPYTPELYESACHLLGTGAIWRLNTGNGYRLIRLHLVDWWRQQVKTVEGSCSRPMFEFVVRAGCKPESHSIYAPRIGCAKVMEFLVHVEDPLGQLEIEVKTCNDVSIGDGPPCFSGFEVLQDIGYCGKDLFKQTRGFKTAKLQDMPRLLDSTVPRSPRPRSHLQAGYLRQFEKWSAAR